MIWKMIETERRSLKEVLISTLQHNHESEIEDLMNPKDELKKKIVSLASTIRKWNEETVEARKTVRMQLKEILDLGLNKYKMQKTELRNLVDKIFRYHSVSESWIRKLLPEGLKYTSKTRLSYLQKQEIEKERQRLLQQQASDTQQESDQESYSTPSESSVGLVPLGCPTIQFHQRLDHCCMLLPYGVSF